MYDDYNDEDYVIGRAPLPENKKPPIGMLICVIISLILVVGLTIILASVYSQKQDIELAYEKIKSEYNDASKEVRTLKGENSSKDAANKALESNVDDLKDEIEGYKSQIKDYKDMIDQYAQIGNYAIKLNGYYSMKNDGSQKIEKPKASQVCYLGFNVSAYSLKGSSTDDIDVYIDIIKPNGEVYLNTGNQHTMKTTIKTDGKSRTTGGYGNDNANAYTSGTYRVIFYYGNTVIGGGTITL